MEQTINLENQNLDQSLNQATPQKNTFKILFFVSLGLLLITGSVLATLLINQKFSSQTQTIPTVIEETKLTPTQSISSETTDTEINSTTSESEIPSDWKTYTDSTYKFSIYYPSTWTVDTKSVNNRILSISSPEKIKSINNPTPYQEGYSGDDFFVRVYSKTLADCQDLEACFKSTGDEVSNVRKIKIGKNDAYLADEAGMVTTPVYFIFNSTNLFRITSFISFSETEKQILDTLKFN